MRFSVLASGSSANAAVIEGPQGAILIDCGLNRRTLLARLAEVSVAPVSIKTILITHEHSDHISGLGVVLRELSRLGNQITVYATAATLEAIHIDELPAQAGELSPQKGLTVAGIDITPFSTAHDVADPVGFRFEHDKQSIGYATDTGHLTPAALQALHGCGVLAIETNHDPQMLRTGPYPAFLKRRISCDHGHLSNTQAADALKTLLAEKTAAVVGMHLSRTNNEPQLSRRALQDQLDLLGHQAQVLVSSQFMALRVL